MAKEEVFWTQIDHSFIYAANVYGKPGCTWYLDAGVTMGGRGARKEDTIPLSLLYQGDRP